MPQTELVLLMQVANCIARSWLGWFFFPCRSLVMFWGDWWEGGSVLGPRCIDSGEPGVKIPGKPFRFLALKTWL